MLIHKLCITVAVILAVSLLGSDQSYGTIAENRTLPTSLESNATAVGPPPLLGRDQSSGTIAENRTLPTSLESNATAVGPSPLLGRDQSSGTIAENRTLPTSLESNTALEESLSSGPGTEQETQKCEECSSYIVDKAVSIAPGNKATSTSFCDAGDALITSGYYIDFTLPEAAKNLILYANGPVGNKTLISTGAIPGQLPGQLPIPDLENQEGWRVGLFNGGNTNATITSSILCANITP